MKALIVYDSMYGNTEQIARAIAGAIDESRVLRVDEASNSDLESINLLVIGSPTHAFRPTKPVQAFIESIPRDALKGIRVAAFDTRIPAGDVGKGLRLFIKIGGYAAPHIAQTLKKKGGHLIVPPEGFFVKDKEGPLKEGELERAAGWAKGILKSKQ
ncbi:MAG TPA: flavodoxin family protein [Chloroflexi bacterium]|nr:flavodoxin family protein [Chloroflexota bacterium]